MVYGGLTMCMEMTGEGVGGCIIINRATWPVILSRSVLLQRRGEESFNKVPNKLKFPLLYVDCSISDHSTIHPHPPRSIPNFP